MNFTDKDQDRAYWKLRNQAKERREEEASQDGNPFAGTSEHEQADATPSYAASEHESADTEANTEQTTPDAPGKDEPDDLTLPQDDPTPRADVDTESREAAKPGAGPATPKDIHPDASAWRREDIGCVTKALDKLREKTTGHKPNGGNSPSKAPHVRPASPKGYKPKQPFSSVEGIGTAAWQMLDPESVWVLTEFYIKFNGRNRDNLSLTHREIHGKMCSVVFQRCVWQLVGYGFLDVKRWGRLQRNCSIYGLSSRWQALSAYPKRLEDVKGILATITSLLREPGSAEKRERINALRRQVCEGYAAVPHKGNGK